MLYPSDLSDIQWEIIKPILPQRKERGFKKKYSDREMINAILYINKTGCHWRYLPNDFPAWESVYGYFRMLNDRGIFEKINSSLREKVRILEGRDENPSLLCIDSQSVKGDINLAEKGIDGFKKVKGRKRHIAVDVLGLVVFCFITAANVSDIHPGRQMIEQMHHEVRLKKVLVDAGYQGLEGDYGNFSVDISSKKTDQKGFIPQHKRWVVERSFSRLNRQRRLSRDYEYEPENQKAMVYIGMMKIMLNRISKKMA